VVAYSDGSEVTSLVFCVSNALDGEAIDLTPPDDGGNGTAAADSQNVTVVSYYSENSRVDDLVWTAALQGKGDSDMLCEAGELFEITVDLSGVGESVGTYHTFSIEVKPPTGSVLPIERTTPAALDTVMILD
jgi:archaellin